MPTLLHVGCGPKTRAQTTRGFAGGDWTECRLDIDPAVRPDVTGTMTSVADANLLGLESNAGIAAAATRTSGTSKNVVKRIGYIGGKRYVSASIKSTVTAAVPVAAHVVLTEPFLAPVAT